MRIVRLVSVSLVAGLLAVSACKKDEKAGEGGEEAAGGETGEATKPADPGAGDTATPGATAPEGDTATPPGGDPAAPGTEEPVKPAERPASVTPEMAALADRVMNHMEAIATAAESNQADCKKAGAAMQAEAEKARPDIEKMEEMTEKTRNDPSADAWFKQNYESRLMAMVGKLMPVVQKCQADPDFQKAMKAMEFMGGKKDSK